MSMEHSAHRIIISYCIDQGMTHIQTLRKMGKIRVFSSVSRTLVYTWHKHFKTEMDVTTAEKKRQTEKEPSSANETRCVCKTGMPPKRPFFEKCNLSI